jgi:hypothetical protein
MSGPTVGYFVFIRKWSVMLRIDQSGAALTGASGGKSGSSDCVRQEHL